jgi:hypothetical protein
MEKQEEGKVDIGRLSRVSVGKCLTEVGELPMLAILMVHGLSFCPYTVDVSKILLSSFSVQLYGGISSVRPQSLE